MAKNKKEKPETFTYEDKEYVIQDMKQEEQAYYFHVRDLQNKLNTNAFTGDQLRIAQEAFVKKLTDSLKAEEVEAEVE
jgi:hypothetical protein|tara:strand:- start:123 stop:356 length:234 start_codon:yes stop_codon:yes gene_type:complete